MIGKLNAGREVEPYGFETADDGRIITRAHQVVRNLDGNLLADGPEQPIYRIQDGYIRDMEIRK